MTLSSWHIHCIVGYLLATSTWDWLWQTLANRTEQYWFCETSKLTSPTGPAETEQPPRPFSCLLPPGTLHLWKASPMLTRVFALALWRKFLFNFCSSDRLRFGRFSAISPCWLWDHVVGLSPLACDGALPSPLRCCQIQRMVSSSKTD